jgi:predicted amidohydrolase
MQYKFLINLWLVVLIIPSFASDINKKDSISVASLSIFPKKWDKEVNTVKIEQMVRKAAEQGAQIIITPEGVLEGFVITEVLEEKDSIKKEMLTKRFLEIAEPMDGKYFVQICHIADELDIYMILGFLESDGDKLYNSAALIDPAGKVIGKYRKTHFWQRYKITPPGYIAGSELPIFDIGTLKIGIMICADRSYPEVTRILTLKGADLIACPAYGGWGELNNSVMRTRAFENQVNIVFTHPQQSLIIDTNGKIVREGGKDTFIIKKIPLSDTPKNRPSVIYRRPELYKSLYLLNEMKKVQ